MAKLFANKFNLDQLPDPVKVEPISTDTQALNARLREVDNQKKGMSTSDDILEQQGVTKSAAEQYVSRTKVEPFGDKPVDQGSVTVKQPNELADKVSTVEPKKVDQGSKVTDPKIVINPIDQGSKIIDPQVQVNKVDIGDKITNPETPIKPVIADELITNPNIEIKKVKDGDRITDPKTRINIVAPGDRITDPKLIIKKVESGDRTTDPKTVVQLIKAGDRITDPKTIVTKAKEDEFITNPNIRIKNVVADELITNPNIEIKKVIADELIVDPKTPIKLVNADELITNPNTVINKVKNNELITNPEIEPQKIVEIDPTKHIPNLYSGIGVTKLFPKTISLKNRLNQSSLGTTTHLPEYILSDQNTGYITIKNPVVLSKVSLIDPQRIRYQDTVLKQGGVEDLFEGITSIINPLKLGSRPIQQSGEVIIKKVEQGDRITDPDTKVQKIKPGDRITDPKIEIQKIKPGDRITDPDTPIKLVEADELIVDPDVQIKLVDQGSKITDPKVEIKPTKPGELITDPKLKIKPIVPGERTTDPKLVIKPIVPGERTVDPKTKIQLVKPGERTINPETKINPVQPGERTFNPNIAIRPVEPGERTFDPNTIIIPIEPGERTFIPSLILLPFREVDDKLDYVPEPTIFENPYSIYPSDGRTPLQGDITVPAPLYDPLTIFPGEKQAEEAIVPAFIGQTGVAYTNRYSVEDNYKDVVAGDSPLKTAGESETPTLVSQYNNPSSTVIEQKVVAFPNAQFGDPNLPGGYRTLNYGELQNRRSNNPNKNLDFSYEDRSSVRPSKDVLGMPDKGADTLNSSVDATANDFAVIKLRSTRDNITLQFRSYIKGFSDSFTPSFSDVNYIGRPDTLKVFKGTTRQIGLSFIIPATSKDELKTIYKKLETLVKIGTMGKKDGYYMQGPFLLLTVGGWCSETPIILGSLKYDTNPSEYTWDIDEQVPQLVDVSMDCTVLGANDGGTFLNTGTFIQYGA